MSAAEKFVLIDAKTIAHQLREEASRLARLGTLPLTCFGTVGVMELAARRLEAMHDDIIKDHAVPGWSGWTQFLEGWLLKVTEQDGEVWMHLRGPEVAGQFGGLVIHKPSDSGHAQLLRQLRKACAEIE